MAKFSFHCQCNKAGQLGGIDKHNRRLKDYIFVSKSGERMHE